MNDNQITVSVRLSPNEYAALRTIANENYNTMSGALRRLIIREAERSKNVGKSNGQFEQTA